MPKAYWIACYRSVSNPAAVAEYAKLAQPAIEAAGGRFLARGLPAKTYEAGNNERTALIEFDSVARAIAAYESDAYKAALRALEGSAVRDMRIVEGIS
jgi:uncharacterized protein (DUF1330 family)